jgi:hypothetical protein
VDPTTFAGQGRGQAEARAAPPAEAPPGAAAVPVLTLPEREAGLLAQGYRRGLPAGISTDAYAADVELVCHYECGGCGRKGGLLLAHFAPPRADPARGGYRAAAACPDCGWSEEI